MNWVEITVSILSGLAVTIPLVVELVKHVKQVIKEKNWNIMLNEAMRYMAVAEEKFETGAERKEWVLAMVQESADIINHDVDLAKLSDMIDKLCALSKHINK